MPLLALVTISLVFVTAVDLFWQPNKIRIARQYLDSRHAPALSLSGSCFVPLSTAFRQNERLSVSSTENSAIESHPQTVSQNSSFSEMTTENTDRVSVNACQDTDTLVQPCLATAVGLARSSPYRCTASTVP